MTRKLSTPRTRKRASATERSSPPMRQVPIGCHMVVATFFTHSARSSSEVRWGPGSTSSSSTGLREAIPITSSDAAEYAPWLRPPRNDFRRFVHYVHMTIGAR